MDSLLIAQAHPMVMGAQEDLHTAEAAIAWLRPRCPRCGRLEVTPMTWYDAVVWLQCARCYKLWHESLEDLATFPSEPHDHASP